MHIKFCKKIVGQKTANNFVCFELDRLPVIVEMRLRTHMSKFWFKVRKYNTCNCILKAQEHDSAYWELDCMYKRGIGKTWFTFL